MYLNMYFLKKINIARRFITKYLTSFLIGRYKFNTLKTSPLDVKRILISRPNHRLGNLLLISPLVQEINTVFPNAKIDFFVKGGVAQEVFKNYDNIGRFIQLPKKHFRQIFYYIQCWFELRQFHYDLAINVEQSSSSGRLSVKLSKSKYKFLGDLDFDSSFNFPVENARHNAIFPVLNFRNYLQKSSIDLHSNQIFPLNLKLSNDELNQGKLNLIEIISRNNLPTIALFTYATGDKCYTKEWWQFFLNELKHHFENDYNLIEILPVENVSQIDFSLPTFYSKDIRQIASLIANTKIFIGADSGMMHLASASKTTTIGLFSVTDSEKYAPFGNNSFAIRTNEMVWSEMISSIKKVLV